MNGIGKGSGVSTSRGVGRDRTGPPTRNGEGLGKTKQSPIKKGKSFSLSRKESGGKGHSHPRGLRTSIARAGVSFHGETDPRGILRWISSETIEVAISSENAS
jgi:hypothetical protein